MTPGTHAAWPADLRGLHRYLPWRGRLRPNGRLGKVPHAAFGQRLYPHDPLDPAAWMDFESAGALVRSGQADGFGAVLTRDLGLVGIDLDHCVDARGRIDARAQRLLDCFPHACAEWSPGGDGLHLLVRGRLPMERRAVAVPGVDLIDHGYLTVTGRTLRAESRVVDASAELARCFTVAPEVGPSTAESRRSAGPPTDDTALIARAVQARNGALFGALWRGDLAGYPTRSEGDLALIMVLLYWAGEGADDARIDRLYRQSLRFRTRWDLPVHDPYGRRTIRRAREIRASGRAGRTVVGDR